MTIADIPITKHISMDEPAIQLYEINEPSPDSTSIRRYRHIRVVRHYAPAEYIEDMGLASEFGEELSIQGGVEEGGAFVSVERVGDLIDYANALKERPFDMEDIVPTDLIGGYHDVMEQRRLVLTGGV
jgi:hypothetical protein